MIVKRITRAQARRWFPKRSKDAHKSDCGRIFILAGSKGMGGAAVLVSMGAVRAGAGLVLLGTVESQQPMAAKRAPLEVMSKGFPEDQDGRLSLKAWIPIQREMGRYRPHILAVGPGLGQNKGTAEIIKRLIRTDVPLVLDADGLNLLASLPKPVKRTAPWILTPHTGELARLLNTSVRWIQANRMTAAVNAANRFGGVCLLKGPGTLITDGQRVWQNTTGNPGMASGGMGDVLTGIIAGLWGQTRERSKDDGLHMAALGAYLHGLAADIAARKMTQASLLASDVIACLPVAIKQVL